MNISLFDQVRELSVEEQLELVEAIWDRLVDRLRCPVRQTLRKRSSTGGWSTMPTIQKM
jgi:hypothetical protein